MERAQRYRCPACGLERDVTIDVPGTIVRHLRCPDTLATLDVVMTTDPHPCHPRPGDTATAA